MAQYIVLNYHLRRLLSFRVWNQPFGKLNLSLPKCGGQLGWRKLAIANCFWEPRRGLVSTFILPGYNETDGDLASEFGRPTEDVNRLYNEAEKQGSSIEEMDKKLDFLKKNGLTMELMLKNTWLLTLPTKVIFPKVFYLNKIGINSFTVSLLKFQLKKLQKIVYYYEMETMSLDHRIEFLAKNLQCSVEEVAKIVENHTLLLTMNYDKLVRVTQMLLSNGISGADIRRDLWVYMYREELVARRLKQIAEVGLKPVRVWMCRCPEDVFTNKLNHWLEAKEVLGKHTDCLSYLAERLKCSRLYVNYLLQRRPELTEIHPPKLKDMFDFLYASGYKPVHICQFPATLLYSVDHLRRRHKELKDFGYRPKNLQVLCAPHHKYVRLIARLKSEKTNVENVSKSV